MTWWTIPDAEAAWPDQAGPEDDESLARYLDVAYEQAVAYGPYVYDDVEGVWIDWDSVSTEPPHSPVPERFRQAQLLQARAVWAFERTGGGDMIGPDGMQVRTYPMGWQVKNLLRPDTGEPVIG